MRGVFLGIAFAAVFLVYQVRAKVDNPVWDAIYWIAVLSIPVIIITLIARKKGARLIPLIGMAVCAIGLFVFGGWYFWPSAADQNVPEEAARLAESVDQVGPLVEVIRQQQDKLALQDQAQAVSDRILHQYDQLEIAINAFRDRTGTDVSADELTALKQMRDDLRLTLQRDVQMLSTPDGDVLIIQIGPNLFRVTFAVPMRIAPDIQFVGIASGVTGNVTEKTKVGFTVLFSPLSTPVTGFGFTASAEL